MSFATNKILLLLLCVFTYCAQGQDKIQTYTKSNGLTSSTITFTFLDSQGIVWAASNQGVNAFTGKKWVAIKSITDRKGERQNMGQVFKIIELRNGDLWIAAERGIFIFNGDYWTAFTETNTEGFFISEMFEDKNSRVWVLREKRSSTKDVGQLGFSIVEGTVEMFQNGRWYNFLGKIGGSAAVKLGEPLTYFTSHLIDSKSNVWITSLDGLYRFDSFDWVEFNQDQLPSDRCQKVLETRKGDIWVATSYGIARQDGEDWEKFEKSKGIKDNINYDLFEDSHGRLWSFSKRDHRFKALCLYRDNKWEACFKSDLKLKTEVDKLLEIDNNLIAFSTSGLSAFDGKKWHNLIHKNKIDDNNFGSEVTFEGDLFFAGQKGIYSLSEDRITTIYKFRKKLKVSTILTTEVSDIWVGTEKNGVVKINNGKAEFFTEENGLSDNKVKSIFLDKRANIWIVTKSGISRFSK